MDWKLVAATFGMVFLAELGDKTQLLVFNLAAQHRAPWAVVLGASLALSLVSLLGAFVGGSWGSSSRQSTSRSVLGPSSLGWGAHPLPGLRLRLTTRICRRRWHCRKVPDLCMMRGVDEGRYSVVPILDGGPGGD